MPEEPEEGFTVRDRRRFLTETSDATPIPTDKEVPSETSSPTTAFAAPSPEEEDADEAFEAGAYFSEDQIPEGMGMPEEFTLPDIYAVLLDFLGVIRSHAWFRMGLVVNPSTGKTERDMEQAKVAIDTAAFLVGQLERVVAPEERLPLRAFLSDLQMNFVEQSKRGE